MWSVITLRKKFGNWLSFLNAHRFVYYKHKHINWHKCAQLNAEAALQKLTVKCEVIFMI